MTRLRTALGTLGIVALALLACKEEKAETKPAAAPVAAAAWKVGDQVDVEWKGSWWQGEILAVEGAKYKVHYTGWASSWDESVEASRVRTRTATSKKGSGAGAKPKAAAPAKGSDDGIPAIPEGRSKPATVAEWKAAPEVNTQEINSRPAGCSMKVVREWLKVNCSGKDVTGTYSKMEGFGTANGDYFESLKPGKHVDFVLRMKKGKVQKVRIHKSDNSYASLFVNWPGSADKPKHIALGKGGG